MRDVFPRSARSIPVFSQAGFFLSGIPAGRAEEKAGREGKIKETGTTRAGFLTLLLSAHWLGEPRAAPCFRSEEHTSELQSLMRVSDAVFCLKKKRAQLRTPRN